MKGQRGSGIALPSGASGVGMPTRVFLFTLDQIALMVDMQQRNLEQQHVYFEGRSIGTKHRELMIARNIAPPDSKPDWRIAEREFVRWLRFKGFRVYETGAISN